VSLASQLHLVRVLTLFHSITALHLTHQTNAVQGKGGHACAAPAPACWQRHVYSSSHTIIDVPGVTDTLHPPGLALNESLMWDTNFTRAAAAVMSPPIRGAQHGAALKAALAGAHLSVSGRR
jgi:hypothetical protein